MFNRLTAYSESFTGMFLISSVCFHSFKLVAETVFLQQTLPTLGVSLPEVCNVKVFTDANESCLDVVMHFGTLKSLFMVHINFSQITLLYVCQHTSVIIKDSEWPQENFLVILSPHQKKSEVN